MSTTTTTLARDNSLSRTAIINGWHDYLDGFGEEAGRLADLAFDTQVATVNEGLPEGCQWLPWTSEITGPVGTDLDSDVVSQLLEQGAEAAAALIEEAAGEE